MSKAHQQEHRFAVKATSEPKRLSVSPCSRFALSLRPRAGCAVANEKCARRVPPGCALFARANSAGERAGERRENRDVSGKLSVNGCKKGLNLGDVSPSPPHPGRKRPEGAISPHQPKERLWKSQSMARNAQSLPLTAINTSGKKGWGKWQKKG